MLNNSLATCRAIGRKIGDLVRNPEVFCDAQCASYEKYGYDAVLLSSDVAVEAEAMGGKAVYPEDAAVALVDNPVKSEKDFLKLVPPNPLTDGRMAVMVKTVELIRKKLGENAFITASASGPVNMASQLFGVEKFLIMFIEEPEFLEKVLDFTAEITVLYAKALFKAGATCITMGEAMCACNVIGKSRYIEFVQKRHKRIVEEYERCGIHNHILHICGNIAPILSDVADTGIASIDIDTPVSFKASRETLGRRISMTGNIAPAELLLSAPERITELCADLLSEKEGLGLILGAGCNMNVKTPEKNIHAMVDAAKTYGVYQ